ncbi:MAG: hypothetical protein H3C26_08235 [Rhodocyclaceae bacterium]|nr:hypothetical protein [Rhodocyclaceae bacterium]
MKPSIRRSLMIAALLGTTLGGAPAPLPAAEAQKAPPARRPAAASSQQVRAAAEVVAVDRKARTLKLKREDGNAITVTVGSRVADLARIDAGDLVVVQYGLARALSMKKTPVVADGDGDAAVDPATVGPTGTPQRRQIIADIIAIDDRTGQVTLKGLGGDIVDVVFRNRRVLASVRIGDRVRAEYADAVAVSIRPAGRAIPPKRQSPP